MSVELNLKLTFPDEATRDALLEKYAGKFGWTIEDPLPAQEFALQSLIVHIRDSVKETAHADAIAAADAAIDQVLDVTTMEIV